MKCSIFGLFLIGYIVYIALKAGNLNVLLKNLIVLTMACSLNIRMGYFLRMDDSTLGFSNVLIYVTGLVSLIVIIKKRNIPQKMTLSVVGMICILTISACKNIVFPYQKSVITGNWTDYVLGKNVESYVSGNSLQIGYYLTLLSIGMILIAADSSFQKEDFQQLLSRVVNVSKISICVGYVEYITKNFFHTKIVTDIFCAIFGSQGAQQNLLVSRGGLFTVQGATKESSMFTTVIFYITIMLVVDYAHSGLKTNKKWIVLCMLLLILNPTISSIVYLGILILTLFIYKDMIDLKGDSKIKLGRILCVVGIIIAGGVFVPSKRSLMLNSDSYIIRRLGLSIQQLQIILSGTGSLTYSSEAIRFSGIVYDMERFAERPWLGFGLGTLSCNSGIVTFLVNTGILGFGTWFNMIITFMSKRPRLNCIVFAFFVTILPSILLNDYETILCIIIPVVLRCFTYLEKKNISKSLVKAQMMEKGEQYG